MLKTPGPPTGSVKVMPITCALEILHLQRTGPPRPSAAARATMVSAERGRKWTKLIMTAAQMAVWIL